jgi:hypothetical protein
MSNRIETMLEQMRNHEETLKQRAEKLQRELAETMDELAAIGRAIQAYRVVKPRSGGRLAPPIPNQTAEALSERRRAAGRKGSAERWRRKRERDAEAQRVN